ncbi:hypothetical protein [Candidatus Poriferisodalis sp.]|uniref:hypothetical protein n=1 Tax=Candidatus Poriferisodalis sp. TaxID=3101277 RepID=UPI003B01BBF0
MVAGAIDRGRGSYSGSDGDGRRAVPRRSRAWRRWAAAGVVAVLAAGLVVPVSAGPAWAQIPPPAVDYDVDDDGLIEVSSLAQLNAIRWDLDGDGTADVYPPDKNGITGHDPDGATKLAAAFPDAAAAMGCPSDGCSGYELVADLDFDTNANGQADSGDAYWNAGKGWFPLMGGEAVRGYWASDRFKDHVGTSYFGDRPNPRARMFTAVFEGNGRTIANLFIDDLDRRYVGLFGYVGPGAHVRNVGLSAPNPDSRVRGNQRVGALAGVVERARVSGAWSDVDVTGAGTNVGGLVGSNWRYGFVVESYATGDVSGEKLVGGLIGMLNWSGVAASYATGDVTTWNGAAGGLAGYWVDGRIRATYATGSVTLNGALRKSNGLVRSRGGGLVGLASLCGRQPWPRMRANYSVGRVSGPQGGRYEGLTGGCAGTPLRAVAASYWDTDTSGATHSPADVGAGYTTAQLQAPTGYAGIYADWNVDVGADGDFGGPGDDPWDFGTSSQYPVLKYCADKPGVDTADGEPYCPLDPVRQRSGTVLIEVVPDADDADDAETPEPAVSVTAASGGTEGSDAVFMLSAVPAPQADLDVIIEVTASGDFGAAPGSRTVTIGTGGSATVTVPTVDDSVDEADGSVTVSVQPAAGYTVGAVSSLSADVVDDDEPTGSLDDSSDGDSEVDAAPQGSTVDAGVVAKVEYLASQVHHGSAHVNRWQRVLVAFGALDAAGVAGGAMTVVQAQYMADTHSSPVWDEVVAELTALEAAEAAQDAPTSQDAPSPGDTSTPQDAPVTQDAPVPDGDAVPAVVPEVSIVAGSDVTESGDAVFTLTADPAPTIAVDVSVTVSAVGEWGAAGGTQTVTFAADAASATLTIPTVDDGTDEADGSVSVALDAPAADAGYTVSAAQGTASVRVSDDDVDPLTVYMIFFATSIDENGAGYDNQAQFAIAPTRALRSWETLTVPLSVTGGDEGTHWTMRDRNDPDAVFANEFEVTFGPGDDGVVLAPGDQRVELVLTAVADSDWVDQAITVSYGTGSRAPTLNGSTEGVTLGISWGPDGVERADGSTTVVIVDSDDPPPQVSITAAAGGTEGTAATFTITASAPVAADLDVDVTVSAIGDWRATTGTQTVTIPQGAAVANLTVATADDSTDEPDGTITATLAAGSGYVIGQQPTQTAHITDDDDPPPEPAVAACTGKPRVSVADAAAQRGDDLEFVISLSCRSSGAVTVYYFVAYGADFDSVRTVDIASGDTDATVNVPTTGVNTSITFHVVYTIGAANYSATATSTITG